MMICYSKSMINWQCAVLRAWLCCFLSTQHMLKKKKKKLMEENIQNWPELWILNF